MHLIKVTEGKAKLMVPKESFKDPFHLPVFYNPSMELSRSIGSLAFSAIANKGTIALDGLSSIGARGIRYLVENSKIKKMYFVDANTASVKVLKRNLKLNKLKNAKAVNEDLNKFFANAEEYFDFVEIDPFGSPVYFLESAFRKMKKQSFLSITATDMASLSGAYPIPCKKHYDAKPLRCECSHEIALRILLGRIARTAVLYDFGIEPLLSYYQGHHLKVICKLTMGAKLADGLLGNFQYLNYCLKCLERWYSKLPELNCKNCKARSEYAGVLWSGKLCSEEFLKEMLSENEKKDYNEKGTIERLLNSLIEENSLLLPFYDVHVLTKKFKKDTPKMHLLLQKLEKKGFKSIRTHYSPTSFKSTAGVKDIKKIF